LRNGVDLAFETDLLYLDVTNGKVGIKNSAPTAELDITGTVQATNLKATNQLDAVDVRINADGISSTFGDLEINPATPTDNVVINGNTLVNGSLHATGNITAGGNIVFGDSDTDTITFEADVTSDILPDVSDAYDLGNESKRWKEIHTRYVKSEKVISEEADLGGLVFYGNTITTINTNEDIVIQPNGTGNVIIPGVSSLSGMQIELDTPTDGSLTDGNPAVSLTPTTKVTDAIDGLNETLGKLIPAGPPTLQGLILSLNSVGDTPYLATGGVQDNTNGGTLIGPGTPVQRAVSSTVTSAAVSAFGPGDEGTLEAKVNGAVLGSRVLSPGSDDGTYGSLIISNNQDYGIVTGEAQGFHESLDAQVSSAVNLGINRYQLSHTLGSSTEAYFVRDAMVDAPVASGGSLGEETQGTISYSSTVPHYDSGNQINISGATWENVSGETYYGGLDPMFIDFTTQWGSGALDTVALGYGDISQPGANAIADGSFIPFRNLTATYPLRTFPITLSGNNIHGAFRTRYRVKNVNDVSNSVTITSANVLVMTGTTQSSVDEDNVTISQVGTGVGNAVRVITGISGGADTPSITLPISNWDGQNTALQSTDATIVGGRLSHDNTNYSVGYLPVGPNLSVGRSGAQYATFKIQRSGVSKFDIEILGTIAGCWVNLPGSQIDSTAPTTNGWVSMTLPYAGSGIPGTVGGTSSGTLGAAVGGAMPTNTLINDRYTCTFGTESSSNATDNIILVRFKLSAGQNVSFIRFREASN
jgi:hypothetical protein